jgi:hypothetical protein
MGSFAAITHGQIRTLPARLMARQPMVLLYVNEEQDVMKSRAGMGIAGARSGRFRDTGRLPTCGKWKVRFPIRPRKVGKGAGAAKGSPTRGSP